MVDPGRTPPVGFDALPIHERMPVPEWHAKELSERERAYRAAPDDVSTWEAVRERILRRRDSSNRPWR